MKVMTKLLCVAVVLSSAAYASKAYEKNPILTGNLPVFYEQLKEKMDYPLGWKEGISKPDTWKTGAYKKASELIAPDLENFSFDHEIIDEIDRGSYIAKKIVFNVSQHSRVMGLILIPKGEGPFPAALMLHDHGAKFDIGKEKFVETWGDEAKLESSKAWSEKFFSGKFPGDELAKRGYVVLSVDALGWGDRQGNGYEAQQALASNLFNMGTSYGSIIAQEDIKSAEFLASLPEVDRTKVAAVGFSMGSFRAWQAAALSDSITAAIADCWIGTMKGLMVEGNNQLKGQSAYTMMHPGLGRYLDYPDVAGLAAPKPMLFYAGEQDKLFPLDSVKEAFGKMQNIWKANGAGEKLETRFWPLGHVFVEEQQTAAFDWLDKQFGRK